MSNAEQYKAILPLNYTNNIALVGVIVEKPYINQFEKNGKTIKMAIFNIHQITYPTFTNQMQYDKIFTLQTYSEKVIEKLSSIKNQCLVSILGMLARKSDHITLAVNVTDLNIEADTIYPLTEKESK